MATLFLNKYLANLVHVSIACYLLGSLAVYCAIVPKSLIRVMCTHHRTVNASCAGYSDPGDPAWHCNCWSGVSFTQLNVYRLCVAIFGLLVGPWVFSNVSATKHFQVATMSIRWLAFATMIAVSSWLIYKRGPSIFGHGPATFETAGPLLGASIYTFMCHYSLPTVIPPMREKTQLFLGVGLTFGLALLVLSLLSLTAMFTFAVVEDVYPLNFDIGSIGVSVLEYFLALFPVFTLSTNFPLLGITLRNNVRRALFTVPLDKNFRFFHETNNNFRWLRFQFVVEKILVPLGVTLVPLVIVLATDDIEFMVAVTGSYAGVCVQYLLPACLMLNIRKSAKPSSEPSLKTRETGLETSGETGFRPPVGYRSPFAHIAWAYALLAFAALVVAAVTTALCRGKLL